MFSRLLPQHKAKASVDGKTVDIRWTRRAERALAKRTRPLVIELVLEYKCMPVKSVHFHDTDPTGCRTVPATDRVAICLRVATPVQCIAETPETANPAAQVTRPRTQMPKRVRFDYKRGNWTGTFAI